MRPALFAAALIAAAPAAAQEWRVDPARSAIRFEATQAGKPVQGRFARWTASIRFDPAALLQARVSVMVDLASAATGERSIDAQLPTSDWFDTARFAQARFTAARFTRTGPGRYLARGTLALRGVSVPVELPFTLTISGDSATMSGTTRLDRRAFKLGLDSDATAAWVAFAVPVTVNVTARRAR